MGQETHPIVGKRSGCGNVKADCPAKEVHKTVQAAPFTKRVDDKTVASNYPQVLVNKFLRKTRLTGILIIRRGVAQSASALRLGRRGRRFESAHPDFIL